jgi:hypothetical protein
MMDYRLVYFARRKIITENKIPDKLESRSKILPPRVAVNNDCINSSDAPKINGISANIISRCPVSILFLFSYRRMPVKNAYITK